MGKLTVKTIQAAKYKGTAFKLTDGLGLYLHVTATARTWRFRYRLVGKESTFTIGSLELVSLVEARERHRTARLQVLDGIDPVESRRGDREKQAADEEAAQNASITFAAVRDRWLGKMADTGAPATYKKNVSRLNQVPTGFDSKAVVAINEEDIDRLLSDLQNRNKVDAAHRLKVLLRQIFDYAMGRDFKLIEANPVHHPTIELNKRPQYKIFHYPKSKRDMATILQLSADYPALMRGTWLGLQLLPYLAFRPSNVRRLRWAQVDFDDVLIRIEANGMKGRSPFVSPMPRHVVSLLKEQY